METEINYLLHVINYSKTCPRFRVVMIKADKVDRDGQSFDSTIETWKKSI